MNQTTLDGFAAPEKRVYELVEDTLIAVIRKNFLHEKELCCQKYSGYWSITYLSAIIARIHFGKVNYISVDKTAVKSLCDKRGVKYDNTKSEPQFIRIFLNAPEDITDYLDIIAISAQNILDNIPKGFDCCSRYEECSDAIMCLQPDEQLRLDCGYRRIMASGRIFYGKNRNI